LGTGKTKLNGGREKIFYIPEKTKTTNCYQNPFGGKGGGRETKAKNSQLKNGGENINIWEENAGKKKNPSGEGRLMGRRKRGGVTSERITRSWFQKRGEDRTNRQKGGKRGPLNILSWKRGGGRTRSKEPTSTRRLASLRGEKRNLLESRGKEEGVI